MEPYDILFLKKVFRRYRWVHRRAGRTTCSRGIGEASLRHNQLHEVFLPYLPRGDTIAHKNPIIHHIALLCFTLLTLDIQLSSKYLQGTNRLKLDKKDKETLIFHHLAGWSHFCLYNCGTVPSFKRRRQVSPLSFRDLLKNNIQVF